MDPTEQPQLPLQTLPDYHYHGYVPGAIKPCTTHLNDSETKVASLFHLLSCGHIVAIYENDQRCGRNCQHALATSIASQSPAGSNNSQAYVVLTSRYA
jgi:hypothetical protein